MSITPSVAGPEDIITITDPNNFLASHFSASLSDVVQVMLEYESVSSPGLNIISSMTINYKTSQRIEATIPNVAADHRELKLGLGILPGVYRVNVVGNSGGLNWDAASDSSLRIQSQSTTPAGPIDL
ncbi:MAG: hypothetical protein KC444_00815, partial [Nitrosopumilus sp.]|nr:hypothetical protein [Nitrosopumilus sp.]